MKRQPFQSSDSGTGSHGGGSDPSADDYLSKLAHSILSKEKRARPTAPSSAPPSISAGVVVPPPTAAPPKGGTQRSTGSVPRPVAVAPPPPSVPPEPPAQYKDWIREVDYYDSNGKLIPGTIILFEDGNVGVFKERHRSRDYEIIYMLRNTGRAEPEGMPLDNYEVEPIGRLSNACLEQLVRTGAWERDALVFHLLKFKDHRLIPQITEVPATIGSNERVSVWAVQKLDESDLDIPSAEQEQEKPETKPAEALSRGRRVTIQFGPNQKWEAVYWGKDELGHIVAHQTHGGWNLMHLDLNRFKDTIVFHDIIPGEVVNQIQKDCSRT